MSRYECQRRALAITLTVVVISLITTGLLTVPIITTAIPTTSTATSTESPEPTVTLAVNGDSLTPTESITVGSNPKFKFLISVNDSQKLSTVRVAVDNETRRTYNNSAYNQTLSRELDITLQNGAHTIEVKTATQTDPNAVERTRTNNTSTEITTITSTNDSIGQTAATPISSTEDSNETNTVSTTTYTDRFTVVVDTAAPFVKYISPFETGAAAPPPDRPAVTNSTVTLAGTFQDRSDVTAVQITHVYEYDFAGRSQSTRSTYRLSPTDNSFTRQLVLGVGENEITAEYTDEFGNLREHKITILLIDLSAPQVILDRPIQSQVGYGTLQISGSVTDTVKLNKIDLLTPSGGTKRLLIQQGPEPTQEYNAVSISETVQLSPGRNYIQIDATDVSGNNREREATVFYNESIAPQITIESIAASDSTSQLPTIRATGHITREDIVDARIEIRELGTENAESPLLERSLITTTGTDTQSTTNTPQRRVQFDERLPLQNITNPILLRVIATDTENDTEVVTRQLSSITPQSDGDSEDIDSSTSTTRTTTAVATTPTATVTISSSDALSNKSTTSLSSSSTGTPLGITPLLGAICILTVVTIVVIRVNQ